MTVTQIICLVVVVLLAALGGFFIVKKSKKHDMVKWIGLFVFVAMALTWIFSSGYYQGAQYLDYGMNYLGITDLPNLIYSAIGFAGEKIIFLLVLGAFYAVLSKNDGYKKLVVTIAEKFKGKEILFVLISSLLFTAMTALFAQTFIVLIFIPFIISIILTMKLDKITAFCATFGSIIIGILGPVYGGEGLYWFNTYSNIGISIGLIYRLIVLVIGYILFNFFNILHIKKVLKNEKQNEEVEDPFKIENVDKKAKSWPIAVIFGLLFVIMVLGYVSWELNFGITIFKDFHTWLLGLKIGGLEVFKAILGTEALSTPFGLWTLLHGAVILFIVSIIIALMSRMKLNDFISAYGEGFKKIGKCVLLYVGTYMVMLAAYTSPFIPTITNLIFSAVESFNPFLVVINALISGIFHVDFGLTGFLIGTFFTTTYAANIEIVHTIFTTINGFVYLCLPTSGLLLIGLPYLNIEYKTWIKYIWMFAVGMLVILLILFTVMTYV